MPLNQSFPGHSALATFADIRRDLEGSVVRNAAGKMRAGVFPAHFNALVTGRSDMKVAIADFRAVIDRGGAIFMANVGADTSVTLDAAPAANRRIDLIYVTQQSTTLGDTASLPIFGFVKGTASATPVAPSLPANLSTALPLATVEIPAGATTTLSAGVVITQLYPYTAMAGGTVAVRSTVELNAWTPADGSKAYNFVSKVEYLRTAGAWQFGPGRLTGNAVPIKGAADPGDLLITQGGHVVVTTDVGGAATITFPTPFPKGFISIQMVDGDPGATPSQRNFSLYISSINTTLETARIAIRSASGAAIVSTTVRVAWTAIGC